MRRTHLLGILSVALVSAVACGGDDDGAKGGEFATLRGRIAPSTSARIVDGKARAAEVDTSLADAIWAIPVGAPRPSLERKIELALAEDGSFSFTPEEQGTDYILALVDTSACTTTVPRKDWSDTEIDARTSCILGYVSIPDAEGSGSMVLIPTSDMTGDADIGEVTPSASASDEAGATQTLQDLAPSFSIGLDGLQDLARIDNSLKALIWSYANMSDDGSEWYELSAGYN